MQVQQHETLCLLLRNQLAIQETSITILFFQTMQGVLENVITLKAKMFRQFVMSW